MISLLGILLLFSIAVLVSSNRRAIKLRTVSIAFLLQASIAALVLYVPAGKDVLASIADSVQQVINYATDGVEFLFGDLARYKLGFIFVVHVLPVIIFFSSLMAVLYYLGIMQLIVGFLGGGISKMLKTSKPESISAVGNVFVGMTEAPLLIRPYINRMTESELFAVMTGGMASIAGAVMVGFAGMGVELKYLLAASFMAAPGGLLMAKLIKPETEELASIEDVEYDENEKPVNVIDAAASGALGGVKLAVSVGAMLLAFIALIALLNGMLGGLGSYVGLEDLSIQKILGYIFSPIAFLLGVPWAEAQQAGSLIGQKLVLNEFVAYFEFSQVKDGLTPVTQVIVTFALCGFANLSSVAMVIGGLGTVAPKRRPDFARLGLLAVMAGTMSNLMSAVLAGIFVSIGS